MTQHASMHHVSVDKAVAVRGEVPGISGSQTQKILQLPAASLDESSDTEVPCKES